MLPLFFACVAFFGDPAIAEYPSSYHKVFFKEKKPHFYLARKYSEEKKYDLAKAEYSILIEAEPSKLSYRLYRGQLELLLKDYKGALQDAEKILSLTDSSLEKEEAHMLKAQAYAGMNKTEKAIDEFTKVMKTDSQDPKVQFEFGKTLFKSKKYDKALAHLTLARSMYQSMKTKTAPGYVKEADELIAQIAEIQSKGKNGSAKKAD